MTPNVEDFVTPLEKVNNTCVRGIGGMLKIEGKETVAWDITDDKGVKHEIIIPNTYLLKVLTIIYFHLNIGVKFQMTIILLKRDQDASHIMMKLY